MADPFDFSDEANQLDVQRSLDEFAAARAVDDQNRFAAAAKPEQEQASQEGGAGGPSGPAAAAASAFMDSPIGKVAEGVKNAVGWVKKLPRNLSLGVLDAAVNTAGLPFDIVSSMDETRKEIDAAATARGDTEREPIPDWAKPTPFQERMAALGAQVDEEIAQGKHPSAALARDLPEHAAVAYRAWRGELREDDNLGDSLTQGVAQFAVPFTAYSKAFGVARGVGMLSNGTRLAAADAAASASAFAPQDGRAADLAELGLHAENKFGDVMRTLAPDGSLANQYIEWMTDRENEGAMLGRFKNTIDGLGVSAALGGFLKTAALTFRTARKGVQLVGDAAELANAQVTWKKSGVEPIGTRARETHTGLVFEKPEDAQAVADELAHQFGPGFEQRHAAARAAASDKNFATLHSFSKVLQANVDKPVSTHSLIESLEKNLKGDTEQGAFYKELLGRLKAKNLGGTTTVKKGKLGSRGQTSSGIYNMKANTIELSDGAFTSPERVLSVFTHEAVHKATAREMRESPSAYRKISGLYSRVATAFDNARLDAEKARKPPAGGAPKGWESAGTDTPGGGKPDPRPYGFTSPDEFVAEIESNPEFRKLMKDTKIDGVSAWDKYLQAIAGILGLGGIAANVEFSKLMDPKQEEEDNGA